MSFTEQSGRPLKLLPPNFGVLQTTFAPVFLVLGPCAFESRRHCLFMAEAIAKLAQKLDSLVIFKTSFDKANRSKHSSFRGRGLDEALRTFDEIRNDMQLPVLTDVHESWQCCVVAEHVDMIQIPAYLCRQSDLLEASGMTGLPINIKKGQFLAPSEMRWAVEKVRLKGGRPMACERGTFFGYQDLVNDFRALSLMRRDCMAPVIFDATHSCQKPGGVRGVTSGDTGPIVDLIRAAVAVGVDGLFIETHNEPHKARSDSGSMVPLSELEHILKECLALDKFAKSQIQTRVAKPVAED